MRIEPIQKFTPLHGAGAYMIVQCGSMTLLPSDLPESFVCIIIIIGVNGVASCPIIHNWLSGWVSGQLRGSVLVWDIIIDRAVH